MRTGCFHNTDQGQAGTALQFIKNNVRCVRSKRTKISPSSGQHLDIFKQSVRKLFQVISIDQVEILLQIYAVDDERGISPLRIPLAIGSNDEAIVFNGRLRTD